MKFARASLLAGAWLLSARVFALDVGSVEPALSAPSNQGGMLSLQQFRGQPVYVDFWASWCAPCQAAIPALDAIYQRYRAQGLVVLGVNVDSERRDAQRLLDRLKPSFPVLFDPEGKWPETFGLKDMPSSYLIDGNGVVRYIHAGFREGDAAKIEAVIKAVLGEKKS